MHFFCRNTGESACTAVLECGQMDGNPVTWDVTVNSKTIFACYPGKTAADLEAALIGAGLTVEDARRRTTCAVRSNDLLDVRAYTRIGGEIIPVNSPAAFPASTPSGGNSDDHANTLAGATLLPLNGQAAGELEYPDDADYFRLEVPESGTLRVDFDGHGADLNFVVWNWTGRWNYVWWQFSLIDISVSEPGTDYMAMVGERPVVLGRHTLRVSFAWVSGMSPDMSFNGTFHATAIIIGGDIDLGEKLTLVRMALLPTGTTQFTNGRLSGSGQNEFRFEGETYITNYTVSGFINLRGRIKGEEQIVEGIIAKTFSGEVVNLQKIARTWETGADGGCCYGTWEGVRSQ